MDSASSRRSLSRALDASATKLWSVRMILEVYVRGAGPVQGLEPAEPAPACGGVFVLREMVCALTNWLSSL